MDIQGKMALGLYKGVPMICITSIPEVFLVSGLDISGGSVGVS